MYDFIASAIETTRLRKARMRPRKEPPLDLNLFRAVIVTEGQVSGKKLEAVARHFRGG